MYERDEKRKPVVTRCLLYNGGHTALGQAICSEKDNPCKKVGRAIAEGRARKALNNFVTDIGYVKDRGFFKCKINPTKIILTDVEKNWIERKTNKIDNYAECV